jgi:NitT/TauT family transport system substrate-binding protein
MKPRSQVTSAGVTLCVFALLAAALFGGSTPLASAGARLSTSTTINVGSTPALQNASLYLASQNGTFKKHNLTVTTQTVTSGQEAIPLLLNGQIQFTAADSLGAILAIAHKVPLLFVAPAAYTPADPSRDSTALLVKGNSSITTASGFNGKTIAVNAVGGIVQLAAEASIDLAGGDSRSVKFVEIPFPQMVAAVQGGQVDGAVEAEPYVALGKDSGLRSVLSVTSKTMAGVPTVVYVTSKAYAAAHPDIVRAFAASLVAANTELATNPEEVRTVGAKSTAVPPAALARLTLPVFRPTPMTVSSLVKLQTLMVKYKLLPSPLKLAPFVFRAAK